MTETITLKKHITSNKFGVVYPANVKLSFFYEKSLKRYYAQHPSKKSLYIAVDNDNIVEYVDVVFRKFKVRTKEVIALMPYLSGGGKYSIASYMHIGQHSEADYDYVMSVSKPATEEEYADLKAELEDIGYLVNPIKRANHKKMYHGKN